MRFLKVFGFVALAALVSTPVQAGVYGSAILKTSNMVVQYSATGVAGSFTDIAVGFVNITSSDVGLANTARLNGGFVQNLGSGTGSGLADASQAFLTAGAELAPGENTFSQTVPVPATSAFSRADSLVDGTLLNGIGLDTSLVAEIEAADSSLGSPTSSTGAESKFIFSPTEEGFYRLMFDAEAELLVSSIGPPGFRLATATTDLTIQINGADISLDSPSAQLSFDLSGNGSESVSFTGLVTEAVELSADTLQTLTINHVARTSLGAVPEPGSMFAFAGILVAGGLTRLRRVRRS
ncbi:PEP-CTERM sorting domain-containing protein [Planctomycetaceae bacterium SH139]